MADTRPYTAFLEQPRRFWVALGAGSLVLATATGFFLRGDREPATTHAIAAPTVQGRVMVEVLNGTRRQGVARTATRMLRNRGIDVVFLGNADSVEGTTRVIARRGDGERARYVASVLGTGKVVVETDTFRRVDVSVILGDDFRPRLRLHP
jgi:hypothetical protein